MPNTPRPITDWLPITRKEADNRGWDDLDVVLVSGDAYVDRQLPLARGDGSSSKTRQQPAAVARN